LLSGFFLHIILTTNKGIDVTYNDLNLPTVVDFGSGNRIEWSYDVTGAKLSKIVYEAGSISDTRDYLGGIEYINGALDFVATEEGRAVKQTNGTYEYIYDMTDHLGNVRVSFKSDGRECPVMMQKDAYYPFGMRMDGLSYDNSNDNNYLYNGKELEEEHDLNWYHYGARFYDPQLGRWHVVDPIDEMYSPYSYCANNPIIFEDPDGCIINVATEGGANQTDVDVSVAELDKSVPEYTIKEANGKLIVPNEDSVDFSKLHGENKALFYAITNEKFKGTLRITRGNSAPVKTGGITHSPLFYVGMYVGAVEKKSLSFGEDGVTLTTVTTKVHEQVFNLQHAQEAQTLGWGSVGANLKYEINELIVGAIINTGKPYSKKTRLKAHNKVMQYYNQSNLPELRSNGGTGLNGRSFLQVTDPKTGVSSKIYYK